VGPDGSDGLALRIERPIRIEKLACVAEEVGDPSGWGGEQVGGLQFGLLTWASVRRPSARLSTAPRSALGKLFCLASARRT